MLAANIGAGATVGATGLAYQQGVSALVLEWHRRRSGRCCSRPSSALASGRWRPSAAISPSATFSRIVTAERARDHRVADLDWRRCSSSRANCCWARRSSRAVAGLPKWAGVLIGGAAMTGYFSAGGLLSSVGVSAVQLFVKFTGFAIAIPILIRAAGGISGSHTRPVCRRHFSIRCFPPARFRLYAAVADGPNFIVSPGLDPEGLRRRKRARGAARCRRQRDRAADLCLSAGVSRPRRSSVVSGIEARDQVLPTLLLHGLPVWLGALALAAVFSAEMGACEAILFMLSTSLSQVLYKRIVNPAATPAQVLTVARIAAFVGGTAGMLLAIFVVGEIIDALAVFYSIIGATLLVPVVGGLFVKSATRRDALVSIAAGMIAFLAMRFGTDHTGWLNANLWGLVASAFGFFASRLLLK